MQFNWGAHFNFLPDKPVISNERHAIQHMYIGQMEEKDVYYIDIQQQTLNPRMGFRSQNRHFH